MIQSINEQTMSLLVFVVSFTVIFLTYFYFLYFGKKLTATLVDRKGNLWAISYWGLKKSTDNGKSFTIKDRVKAHRFCGRMVFEDSRGYLYWSQWGTGGIRMSVDSGVSWRNTCFFKKGDIGIWGFCEDLRGYLYAGTYTYGQNVLTDIYRSKDGSQTWQRVYEGNDRHIHSIAVDPYSGFIYATTGDTQALILRSKDNGDSWENIFEQKQCAAINFLPDMRLFGDDEIGIIYKTTDDKVLTEASHPGKDIFSNFSTTRYGNFVIFGQVAHVQGTRSRIIATKDGTNWIVLWEQGRSDKWDGPAYMSNPDGQGNIYVTIKNKGVSKLVRISLAWLKN